jgi:malate synthase
MAKRQSGRAPLGSRIRGEVPADCAEILSPEAQRFVAELARRFGKRIGELREARRARQAELDRGVLPDFPAETQAIRGAHWRVTEIPHELRDRRVEITGPTERKMIINALNSGARVFMADCEDSLSPTWENVVRGQLNLRDAVRRTIAYSSPEGREYRLVAEPAVLMVRPRGWHLDERHWQVDGEPVPGALVDFGLYLFHNSAELARRGSGPYFYLPKLEGYREARLWAELLRHCEQRLGLRPHSIKVTVLIETLLAAFEMEEILWELREFAVGLNCGRWDYIFSFIKAFRERPEFVLPERAQLAMTTPFLRSYSQLLIQTCHRRGAFAMGGMAAQIPIKGDPEANAAALASVRADKEREAGDGHDGTWVAHPGLVPVAREVFDRLMPGPNQLGRLRAEVSVAAADLLAVPAGTISETGLRGNASVAIQYLAAWLGGQGCVPIRNLMEDAATAEISRAQLWQWARHGAQLDSGLAVSVELVRAALREELAAIRAAAGESTYAAGHAARAAALLEQLSSARDFEPFLTLSAYAELD